MAGRERGKAIGITSGVIGLGIIAGPALGGFLIETLNWRWIFFINLPIGLLALLLALIFAPPMQPQRSGESFDFIGAGLLAVGLLAMALGLTFVQYRSLFEINVGSMFVVAAVALAIFLRTEFRVGRSAG